MGGKHAGAMGMGSLGFGERSSKGTTAPTSAPASGGFTATELEAHRKKEHGSGAVQHDAIEDFLRGGVDGMEHDEDEATGIWNGDGAQENSGGGGSGGDGSAPSR